MPSKFNPKDLIFGIPIRLFYFIFTASFIPFILIPTAAIGVWITLFLFLYAGVRYAMDEHPDDVIRFDETLAKGIPPL